MTCAATCLLLLFLFVSMRLPPRSTPFPTRRSSDLGSATLGFGLTVKSDSAISSSAHASFGGDFSLDRKSTRLNSSHLGISYAVFCLKKKKKKTHPYCNETTKQTCKTTTCRTATRNE